MNAQPPVSVHALQTRLTLLEHEVQDRTLSDRFGRFYAPLAVLSVALAFMPILETVHVREGFTVEFGTLWEMAARRGGGAAIMALLLVTALISLLVVASVRVRHAGLPASIVGAAALLLLMLWLKPGTGAYDPDLAPAGVAGVLVAVATIVIAAVHIVQLEQRQSELRAHWSEAR
ncbi:MAG: hypothetical protein ACRDTM_05130 [Micromonosporaceae bacterium]